MTPFSIFALVLTVLYVITAWKAIKVVKENQRLVVFRFGKFLAIRPPGLNIIVPFVDTVELIDLNAEIPGWLSLSVEDLSKKVRERALSRGLR